MYGSPLAEVEVHRSGLALPHGLYIESIPQDRYDPTEHLYSLTRWTVRRHDDYSAPLLGYALQQLLYSLSSLVETREHLIHYHELLYGSPLRS